MWQQIRSAWMGPWQWPSRNGQRWGLIDVPTGRPDPSNSDCHPHRQHCYPVEHRRHLPTCNHGQTSNGTTRHSLTYPSRLEGLRELSKSSEDTDIRDGQRDKETVNKETVWCGWVEKEERINVDKDGPMWRRWRQINPMSRIRYIRGVNIMYGGGSVGERGY